MSYVNTRLFGGAITASLPSGFADVSTIRQVPDNQEVYLAKTGLTSIVFELTERAVRPEHPCDTDEEALRYHYDDMVSDVSTQGIGSSETTRIWFTNQVVITHLPKVPAYTMLASQHPQTTGRPGKPDFTVILLTMIRLEQQETDVLVTLNVPHTPGEYNAGEVDLHTRQWGPLVTAAVSWRDEIIRTMAVQDWGLFVQE